MPQFGILVVYYCIRHYNVRESKWDFKRRVLQKVHYITRIEAVDIMRRLREDCKSENDSFYGAYDAEWVVVDQIEL